MAKTQTTNTVLPKFLTQKLEAARKGHLRLDRFSVEDIQLFHLAIDEFVGPNPLGLPQELVNDLGKLKGCLKSYLTHHDATTLTAGCASHGKPCETLRVRAREWLNAQDALTCDAEVAYVEPVLKTALAA